MVRAANASQAVKLVVNGLVEAKAATSDEVARHMEKGGTIQEYLVVKEIPVDTPIDAPVTEL